MRKNHTLFHDIFRSIKSNSSSSTWKTLLKRMEKNKEGISDRRDKTDKHDYYVREIGCKVNRIRFSGSSVERRRVSGLFRKLVRQRGWSGDARRFNLPISNAATDRVAWSLENWIRDGTFQDSRPSLRPRIFIGPCTSIPLPSSRDVWMKERVISRGTFSWLGIVSAFLNRKYR